MYQNDVFLLFKNCFLDQHIKTIQNIKKNNFFKKHGLHAFPNNI